MLKFNNSILFPHGIIECDNQTFYETFVESKGQRRTNIFNAYKNYCLDLKNILECNCIHWINGSFVTTKQNPNDIDIVTFISEEDYKKHEPKIELLKNPEVRMNYEGLVDAYILPINDFNLSHWKDHFESFTLNKIKIRNVKKGFIKLEL